MEEIHTPWRKEIKGNIIYVKDSRGLIVATLLNSKSKEVNKHADVIIKLVNSKFDERR